MKIPPKLISPRIGVILYDEDFGPGGEEVDVIFPQSIWMSGFLMFHEIGAHDSYCWCDPEFEGYDADGEPRFRHHTNRH